MFFALITVNIYLNTLNKTRHFTYHDDILIAENYIKIIELG